MTIEQFLNNVIGSSWLLPLLALGGWVLRNYLRDTFVSVDDMNAYKEAHDKKYLDYQEFVKHEIDEHQRYIEAVDKKANQNGKDIAEVKGPWIVTGKRMYP